MVQKSDSHDQNDDNKITLFDPVCDKLDRWVLKKGNEEKKEAEWDMKHNLILDHAENLAHDLEKKRETNWNLWN